MSDCQDNIKISRQARSGNLTSPKPWASLNQVVQFPVRQAEEALRLPIGLVIPIRTDHEPLTKGQRPMLTDGELFDAQNLSGQQRDYPDGA